MPMTPEEKKQAQQERRKARRAEAKEKPLTVATPQTENVETATTATLTPEPTKKETVEVDRDKLDAVIKRMDAQDEELGILRDSVSKSKLLSAEDKRKPQEKPRVYLKYLVDREDKEQLIVGWKSSPENKLIFNPDGRAVGEVLKAHYYFRGEGEIEMDQVLFTRLDTYAFADVVGTSVKDGTEMFILKMHDTTKWGEETIEVATAFVNP